jgi:hypothetical protein
MVSLKPLTVVFSTTQKALDEVDEKAKMNAERVRPHTTSLSHIIPHLAFVAASLPY